MCDRNAARSLLPMRFAEKQLNCNKNLYNKERKTGKLQREKPGKKQKKFSL
jgi:hypothetical protein